MSDNNKMREAMTAATKIVTNPHGYTETSVLVAKAFLEQAAQSVPVVGEVVGYLAGGTLMRRKIHGYDCKPLIIRPKNPITTAELERLRKDAGRWAALESAVEDGGLVIAFENGKTGTIKLGKGNLRQGIDAAIAAEGEQE